MNEEPHMKKVLEVYTEQLIEFESMDEMNAYLNTQRLKRVQFEIISIEGLRLRIKRKTY